MQSLKWSTSHAVFVPEIDDEHREIFEALSSVQKLCSSRGSLAEIRKLTERLLACVAGHFAHEERLMRASRYGSMRWHKQQHDTARKRVGQFVPQIEEGDTQAGLQLVEYMTGWLHNHTRLSDRMLGAFLRNQQRFVCKLTLRAGTRPADSCTWVDANGDTFDPQVN